MSQKIWWSYLFNILIVIAISNLQQKSVLLKINVWYKKHIRLKYILKCYTLSYYIDLFTLLYLELIWILIYQFVLISVSDHLQSMFSNFPSSTSSGFHSSGSGGSSTSSSPETSRLVFELKDNLFFIELRTDLNV